MAEIEALHGDGVVLRPFRTSDAADVAAGCDDPADRPLPAADAEPVHARRRPLVDQHWCTSRLRRRWWGLCDHGPATERLVGGIGCTMLRDGRGEIGYWVAPWGRGQGFATAATRTLTAYCLRARVRPHGATDRPRERSSQRVAIAAGFTREGLHRGVGLARSGGREDRIMWARLSTDPEGPTQRLLPDLPGGELTDGVIVLRPLGPADADNTLAMRSLPDVIATSVPPRAPELGEITRRCARAEAGWLAGERADLTIRDRETERVRRRDRAVLLGAAHPAGDDRLQHGAGLARAGICHAGGPAVDRVGVPETGIARVVAGTAPDNVASQRVLERAGFAREGYQRARLPGPDGTRIDDVLYALLP